MADTPEAASRPDRPPRPCPICQKMSVVAYRPFCSKRCADIDLSRWFSGVYAAPAVESDEEDEAPVATGGGSEGT
ncbi:DNA gyrase inhibitor YacG [Chelatococcus sambhunathii]|uniref:DNA gyrase inhibitor YacG n=1 Tax=Chelatococcus sambhunathii TaxID=363953 RepID=A0ABU1DKF9_9HYPH|nr:DNA gyrase inhibitor YacG [Chelatococcus sambhunathii]MDR4308621.1 DNA gyrase inhibitor YacG [Chelatococcus sambhunathii]